MKLHAVLIVKENKNHKLIWQIHQKTPTIDYNKKI